VSETGLAKSATQSPGDRVKARTSGQSGSCLPTLQLARPPGLEPGALGLGHPLWPRSLKPNNHVEPQVRLVWRTTSDWRNAGPVSDSSYPPHRYTRDRSKTSKT
jgi:hypothetical protein